MGRSRRAVNSSSFEHIRFRVESGVALIELHRADVLNALLPDMGRELSAPLEQAAGDRAARSVLLTGAGRALAPALIYARRVS